MRFGVYLNLYWHQGRPAMPEIVEQARLAEELGFDWIVLGERHVHRPGYHEILSSAGWLAAHTSRIGIATAGIILPVYPPAFLAESLAHLDVLSGGRLTAGFVLGYRREEFDLFESPAGQRRGRFEEGLRIVKDLWQGEPVVFHGDHHHLDGVFISPVPVQRPRPRIWNGGRVEAALRRAAAECDGWSTSFNEEPDELAEKIAVYRAFPPSGSSLGREVIVLRDGFCASTSQAARAVLEDPLLSLYGAYADWKRDSVDAERYRGVDWETVSSRTVVGSPAQFTEDLDRYREMGADGMVFRVQPPGLAHADALRCIEILGSEVIPGFRSPGDPSTGTGSAGARR